MTQPTTAAARAAALLDLGRPAEAEQAARAGLATAPHDGELLELLAQALASSGNLAEAETQARAALAAQPDNPRILSLLAQILAQRDRIFSALNAVGEALRLAPGSGALHRQQSGLLLLADRIPEAVMAGERARQLSPTDVDTAVLLARVYLAADRPDDARAEVLRALQLDPENAEAFELSGLLNLLHRNGPDSSRDSIQQFRQALRLDPSSSSARAGLATALKARNPIFAAMFRFQLWVSDNPAARRVAQFGPIVVMAMLRPFRDNPLAQVLLGVLITAIVITWVIEPICNLILLASPRDRPLLSTSERRSAIAFAVLLLAALILAGFALGNYALLGPAGIVGLWAIVAGSNYDTGRMQPWVAGATIAALALVVVDTVGIVLGNAQDLTALGAIAAGAGVVCLWIVLLARPTSG